MPQDWQEIQSEPSYHGTEIYKDENIVFVYILPLENPYELYNREVADEFQLMVGDVNKIIESFKYVPTPAQLPNPAFVYCEKREGELEIRTLADGPQKGFYLFDDGSECDEWQFFRGECEKGNIFCKGLCGDGVYQEVVCEQLVALVLKHLELVLKIVYNLKNKILWSNF